MMPQKAMPATLTNLVDATRMEPPLPPWQPIILQCSACHFAPPDAVTPNQRGYDGERTTGGNMTLSRQDLSRASGHLAFASAVAILVSISISQTLLGLSLAALLASREKLRLPRIWLPLALFIAGTLLSLILSPNPIHGLPQ